MELGLAVPDPIEALALVQIARGLFGDLSADAMARIASIEGTLGIAANKQLASAIETGSDKIDVYQRTVDSLEANIGGIRAEAEALSAEGPNHRFDRPCNPDRGQACAILDRQLGA